MKKLLLSSFLFLTPMLTLAQIEIGDFEIPSFKVFVNSENVTYWDDIGAFTGAGSEYWIPNFPSMINDLEEYTVVQLVMKSNVDKFSLRTTITNQLNRQLGQSEVIESPSGMTLTSTGWLVEEDDTEYIVAFSRDPREGTLFVIKQN